LDCIHTQGQEIANIMNDKMSKASICSIVSLDIIDYSVKSEADKLQVKTYFDSIVNQAIADIPLQDRVIVEAVNGVAIACCGPLEDALEDALFISLTVRDEILRHNTHSTTHLYVQLGINLGSARVVSDAEGKPSLVGNGLDDAQRVMCFANPNQILVTHEYYEKASNLTHEISQMFDKYDMHTLEYDVYAVRLLKEVVIEETPSIPADIANLQPPITSKINWRYVGSVMFGLLVFFVITKVGLEPTQPTIILDEPVIAETSKQSDSVVALATTDKEIEIETVEQVSPQTADTQLAQSDNNKALENRTHDQQLEGKQAQVAAKTTVDTTKVEDSSKKSKVQNKVAQKVESDNKPAVSDRAKLQANEVSKSTATTSANKMPVNSTTNDIQVSAATRHAEPKIEKSITKEKSGWESFKAGLARGAERKCTQGEIALNQCVNL
jgi:hypothetical protein